MSATAQFQLPAVAEPGFRAIVPAIVADTHRDAGERFIEFFAATELRKSGCRRMPSKFHGSLALGQILAAVRPTLR